MCVCSPPVGNSGHPSGGKAVKAYFIKQGMIKKRTKLEDFDEELRKAEERPYKELLALYGTLFAEAVALSAISHENIWDGFEVDLRVAQAMGRLKRARKTDKKDSRKIKRR